LKKVFSDAQANEITIKSLRLVGNMLNKLDRDPIMQKHLSKLATLKTSKAKLKVSANANQSAVKQALSQANKYLKKALSSLEGVYFTDAADLFDLALAFAKNDEKRISKMSFDTNIREDMTKQLYTAYMKIYNA